jgi:citrate synthase
MSDVSPGLEGVVVFETEIAEPDKEGSALRYRGVDIEELVGIVPYEHVWGLLVDDAFEPGMPPAEHVELPARTANGMGDLQAATAALGGAWGLQKLIDIDERQVREDIGRLSATMISLVAQIARGDKEPVDVSVVEQGGKAAERFVLQWKGENDEVAVRAIDAYWVSAAEHGMNASTFTARVVASTGSDCAAAMSAAVGALSGPLHGGAPTRVLKMLDEVAVSGDADAYVREQLDLGERLMGFGHRVYRAEDPRARVLRRTAHELGSPRFGVAEELERAALAELHRRKPDRVLATNVEFWSAVVLDVAGIPADLFPALFTCARVAGWSAHILEQKRLGKLIRPSAAYVGPPARSLDGVLR